MTTPVLEVRDLRVYFALDEGVVRAVDGVSFDVHPGQVVGIVGESGCGKTVTMKAVLQIVEPPGRIVGGQIVLRKGADSGLQSLPHGRRSDHRGAPTPPAPVATDGFEALPT
jgi:ABC-type dipeptide/oligopeptide/nickel transport system ATPase component